MKNKIVIIESCIIVILVALLAILVINPGNIFEGIFHKQAKNQLNIEYGDYFGEFTMTTFEGKTVKELPNEGKVSVVSYLSDTCSSCMGALSDYNRFSSVFGETINNYIVWTEDIPQSLLQKYSIDKSSSFALNNATSLSTSTPSFFILDENNNVVFRDTDRINLIAKLIELNAVDKSVLQANANAYILENYYGLSGGQQSIGNKLVYFFMPGCPDCKAADEVFKENPLPDYDMVHIYKYNSADNGEIIDKDKLFVSVYDIVWYPSFLVIRDGEYHIVGETPIESLIAEITK